MKNKSWISVEDSLPAECKDVLTIYEFDSIHGYTGFSMCSDIIIHGKWETGNAVTHWQEEPILPDYYTRSKSCQTKKK